MWGYIGQFIFGFLQYYRFYEVALSKLSGSLNVFFNEGVQGKSILIQGHPTETFEKKT